MCIIPIMSDIRGIITANFDYAEGGSNLVNKYFTFARKFARIWIFFILLTPRLRSLFLVFSPSLFFPLLRFSFILIVSRFAFLLVPRAFLSIYRPLSLFASHIHRRLSTIVNIGYPL